MTKGTVSGVIANMVTLAVDGPVKQGEICYIETGGDKLMSEVIKVVGNDVYVQVFESTRGLKVGSIAEFTGHMLEVQLGPGMLSKNYDGLQNDLDKMDGGFLKRGQYTEPLDNDREWDFNPLVKVGEDRKSTRLNSSHQIISYAVFCLKKKNKKRGRSHAEREGRKNGASGDKQTRK